MREKLKSNPKRRSATVAARCLPLIFVCALSGAGCQSLMPPKVSTTPDELRPGCHKSAVRFAMGRPHERQTWKSGDTTIGEVWHYDDYWWSQGRRGGQNFGSWSVYIDGAGHLAGWRLNSPMPQNPNAREVFYGVELPRADLGLVLGTGVTVAAASDSPAKQPKLEYETVENGIAKVNTITLGKGDTILSLNGVPIGDRNELFRVLSGMKPGKQYPIVVARGNREYSGTITPSAR